MESLKLELISKKFLKKLKEEFVHFHSLCSLADKVSITYYEKSENNEYWEITKFHIEHNDLQFSFFWHIYDPKSIIHTDYMYDFFVDFADSHDSHLLFNRSFYNSISSDPYMCPINWETFYSPLDNSFPDIYLSRFDSETNLLQRNTSDSYCNCEVGIHAIDELHEMNIENWKAIAKKLDIEHVSAYEFARFLASICSLSIHFDKNKSFFTYNSFWEDESLENKKKLAELHE